jgi:hypothetical protein
MVLAPGLLPPSGAAGLARAIEGELVSRLAQRGQGAGAPPLSESRVIGSLRIEVSPDDAAGGSWLQALVRALDGGKEG